jgi:hypothetical protein
MEKEKLLLEIIYFSKNKTFKIIKKSSLMHSNLEKDHKFI